MFDLGGQFTGSHFQGLVAFELWLACYTQEEIADKVDLTQNAIKEILNKSAELPKHLKPYTDHRVDFDPPVLREIFFPE